ncbi:MULTISPECIES: 4Fe-4S dicluster domain-containing protein [Gordonibacter]|uniref:Carboxypeptidase regulatory-like domain-containing protein n=1 Tax=Gordonibacter faecis TaxID=3047475 RepID=A0ABT7DP25_9ACTN|nr:MULTISPECIES: 4Fe-4S dicluster domain-containing protein [unclassified Gordonibacter]MDJ1650298.1 carboxypeptidase regulatory-like domain-containing protein [Gordonibacter sp. KGMB12511]HIW76857.1 carboxypeptidase regulatory-like domain-containing protein [Candidatus Gordonibacter avicola]
MSKVFVVDIDKCNGCHNCQVACKDEHCGQPWPPYSQEQPLTGQFWMKVKEKERGQVPVVRLSYIPWLCNHCEDPACMKAAPEAVFRREDGLVIIDPDKAKGKRELVDACPVGAVFYNEELDLPQKCTGCAHLLDNGWEVPRCVDACPTEALRYVEESEVDLSAATTLAELDGAGPRVYYLNYPKRFVAGLVFDPEVEEVVVGACVRLTSAEGTVREMLTDDFGDFKFDQVEADSYRIDVTADGYAAVSMPVDVRVLDRYVGDIALQFTDDRSARPTAAETARAQRAEAEKKWARLRASMNTKVTTPANFAVVCPGCGKKMNTNAEAGSIRCQFCKTDLTDLVKQKAAECAVKKTVAQA